jgi:transcriptional regulator with XRE-family HTH domain
MGERSSPPSIGERIKVLRYQQSPRMTQRELAERAGVSVDLIGKLEQGDRQSVLLPTLHKLAAALDVDATALLSRPEPSWTDTQPPPPAEVALGPDVDAVEVARLVERSDIGPGALDTVDAIVDRLCRDYASQPADRLLPRVSGWLGRVVGLLGGHARLDEHRRLLVAAGWLEVLRATLQFDVRDRAAAEASRGVALRLGEQAGHSEIVGWAIEVAAWWALVDARLREAVDLSQQGQAAAPRRSSAMVQLAVQEARAWARIGDRRETTSALKRAAVALAALPAPEHPEHHMVFDGGKLHFYAGTCYAWLGMPDAAEEHAREVIRQCGDGRWSTRLANSHVDLGLALARRGEMEGAAEAGQRALNMFKVPPTATLWRASDLHHALRPYGDVAEVRDWRERYLHERRSLRAR